MADKAETTPNTEGTSEGTALTTEAPTDLVSQAMANLHAQQAGAARPQFGTNQVEPGDPYFFDDETWVIITRYIEDKHDGDVAKAKEYTHRRGNRGRPLTTTSNTGKTPQVMHWSLFLRDLAREHWTEVTADERITSRQQHALDYYQASLSGYSHMADGTAIDPEIVSQVNALMARLPRIHERILVSLMDAKTKGDFNIARGQVRAQVPALDSKYRILVRENIVKSNSFGAVDLSLVDPDALAQDVKVPY